MSQQNNGYSAQGQMVLMESNNPASSEVPMQAPNNHPQSKDGNVMVGSVSNLSEVTTAPHPQPASAPAKHHQTAKELDEEEDAKKAKEDDGPKVPFLKLFSFGTSFDTLLVVIGVITAIGNGLGLPIFTLLLKDLVNDGFGGAAGLSAHTVIEKALEFLYLSLGLFACGTISNACLLLSAARQGASMRTAYLRCILRQDIAWFDTTKTGEITTSIERDCANVQGAIGEKIVVFVQNMSTFIGGIVIGFSQGWQEALVLVGALPILAGAGAWMAKNLAEFSQMGERAYRTAGGVAEQAISGIRTVASLNGEGREKERYSLSLNKALEMGLKKARANGVGFGIVMGSFFGTYALGLWFGSWLIINGVTNTTTGKLFSGGDVIMIFFSVVMASFYLGQIGPAVQAFNKGQASARRIYDVVDRVPVIDVHSKEGAKPDTVRGDLTFRGIKFSYPARPDAQIFENLNLDIKAGTTVALVGSSGSGKSTIIQLIMRFYDPLAGVVSLDGVDLRQINVRWLREHVGLVSQEPVLFAASIIKNIQYGKEGATLEEVQAACRMSNAHAFIDALPSKYDTLCGQRGAQLSGGQKQRIAIARAIIADPKILLLDEATSALDTESEKLVQAALDSVMAGRTVVVVAHRLSTIRNADNIVVFRRGVVVEEGNHDTLIQKPDGAYAELVSKQMHGGDAAQGGGLVKSSSHESLQDLAAAGDSTKAKDVDPKKQDKEDKGAKETEGDKGKKKKGKGYVGRAFALNKPEWPWAIIGVLGAMLNGALFPVLATLLVSMLAAYFLCIKSTLDLSSAGIKNPTVVWINSSQTQTYYQTPDACTAYYNNINCVWTSAAQWQSGGSVCDTAPTFCVNFYPGTGSMKIYQTDEMCYSDMRITIRNYCLGFLGLAVAALIANISQLYSFGMMGEHLTKRLRQLTFSSILRQDIGFFDMEENSVGALTTKLAKDASYVEGAVGTTLGLLVQNITLMLISLIIAFIRGWMLTLLCLATFPVMIVAQYFQMQFIAGTGGESNKAYAQAGAVASESIAAIRTVAAFAAEDKVESLFLTALATDSAGVKRTAFIAGLGQGFSIFTMFFLYFCGFAGGGYFMESQNYSFQDVMQVFFSITFMGIGAGQAAALAPDVGKAAPAMESIFNLVDKVPPIDIESEEGERPAEVRGDIELRGVKFRYPARTDAQIFDGLDLSIEAGQTVALVGSSGSGKSTIIGLVQRFYDPQGGAVLLDGRDLRSLNLRWLRRQLGLVSQEPILFATSIAENIRYGKDGASNEEVEEAAKQANAHSFVSTLPDGYNTMCGERGTQLSGGQKQRIAIARAIIANPRILLLDEATSALDAQSEVIVQAALDSLMAGRTVLVVAHRLSTIRNASRIVVFRKGKVVEQGRHDDLLAAAGAYAELVSGQVGH